MLMTYNTTGVSSSFPLHLANENETVKVVNVNGSKHALRQVLAMGLIDGEELQVLSNRPQQDLLIRHEQSHWTIGAGMAKHILVTHLDA